MAAQIMKRSIWQRRIFVCLAVVVAAVRANTELYTLPSFSLLLNVDKSENSLIIFQDRLSLAIQVHLTSFFLDKMESQFLVDGGVEHLSLTSSYVWKELSSQSNGKKKYEVRSNFDCQVGIEYSGGEGNATRVSESIMDLFLIEAFQGDNYWNLVHDFLKDDLLKDITGVKVTVLADGYVAHNNHNPSNFDDYETGGDWTPAMIAGVIFATLLVVSMALLWTYICCFTRDSLLLQCARFGRKKLMEKAETDTDDMYSTSTLNPDEDEDEGKWMDVWAQSVTSIPLREPVRTRKSKRAPSIRHPAQRHSSCLNIIEEVDDESSTVGSVGSSRILNFQSDGRPSITAARGRALLFGEDQISDDSSTTSVSSEMSQPNHRFDKVEEEFEYKNSHSQLERIDETA